MKIPLSIIFEKNGKINKLFYWGFLEFWFFALETDFFEVKKDKKKMKIPLGIIFEENAKHEKIILMRILIFLIFFQTK